MQGDGVYLDAGLLDHLPLTYSRPRRVLEQLRRHAVLDSERPLTDAGPLQPLHGRDAKSVAQLRRGGGNRRRQLARVANDDELLGLGCGQGAHERWLGGLRG